jgi:hypothetical protein
MDDHRKQHADGVGQQVALAADDLFARVIAGRIQRRAPFMEWPGPSPSFWWGEREQRR